MHDPVHIMARLGHHEVSGRGGGVPVAPDERVGEVPEPDRLEMQNVDYVAYGAVGDQRAQQPCVWRIPQHVGHQDGRGGIAESGPEPTAVLP